MPLSVSLWESSGYREGPGVRRGKPESCRQGIVNTNISRRIKPSPVDYFDDRGFQFLYAGGFFHVSEVVIPEESYAFRVRRACKKEEPFLHVWIFRGGVPVKRNAAHDGHLDVRYYGREVSLAKPIEPLRAVSGPYHLAFIFEDGLYGVRYELLVVDDQKALLPERRKPLYFLEEPGRVFAA